MIRLPCPFCGPRDYTEFSFGGDANARRPADPDTLDDASWSAYLYMRENLRGAQLELWQHAAGCQRWIVVCRDTATHAVLGAAPPAAHGGA